MTVRGQGRRTRVTGQSLDELRCSMPDEDRRGCGDDTAPAGLAAVSELEQHLAEARSSLEGPRGSLLAQLFDAPIAGAMNGRASVLSVNFFPRPARFGRAACVDLEDVDGIVFEQLSFRDCWLTAIRAVASRHITLRDSDIVGGSYGLAVRGARPDEPPALAASHITVERVTWIQDPSRHRSDPLDRICRDGLAWQVGCPGDMWRSVPWGVSHHAAFEHWNGALLGGQHVRGDVIFRDNIVINAYNGIRLTARACSRELPASAPERTSCPYNDGIWVTGNIFSYIRDNPVELEDWATNAFIAQNQFHNAHAWLSFDGMGGGPVYVYGNRGWFDDRPADRWSDAINGETCVRQETVARPPHGSFDPRLDRRFDYTERVWERVGLNGGPDRWLEPLEMQCVTSTIGRVLKFSLPERGAKRGEYNFPRRAPVYVFNNSWFLRAPVTGVGAAGHLRHWNNAILFCAEGEPGHNPRLCDPRQNEESCGTFARDEHGLERFAGEARGRMPFFDCFRWTPFDEAGSDVVGLDPVFDYDVSSIGFPPSLKRAYGMERNGRWADPGFIAPERGDFRLKPGAAAATSSCTVQDQSDGVLTCETVLSATSFAGALTSTGELYAGPTSERFRPPPPSRLR